MSLFFYSSNIVVEEKEEDNIEKEREREIIK